MRLATLSICLLCAAPALIQGAPAQDASAPETRSFTDDLGRTVTLPARPQRIVTLWDGFLTVPLLELGVVPVGSQGRGDTEQTAYIRGGALIAGVDFPGSDIAWVGNWPVDVERIATLAPDLIITAPWMEVDPEVLQAIAPTVSLDPSNQPMEETFAELAELTGTEARLQALQASWQAQLARLKALVPPGLTVSTLFTAGEGEFYLDHGAGAAARILDEIGVSQPAAVAGLPEDAPVSAELVPSLDADVILSLVYTDRGLTPSDHLAWAETALPDFCQRLTACAEGRMYFLPIEEDYAASYAALGRIATAMAVILSAPGLADR